VFELTKFWGASTGQRKFFFGVLAASAFEQSLLLRCYAAS